MFRIVFQIFFSHPQEVSIFVFDKKSVDKLHKPKRKEAMTELLKNGLGHLQCYRHPKLLLGAFHSKPKYQNYLPSKLLSL
jgi:hypothetical protein